MPIKHRQAVGATWRLLRDPWSYAAAMRLVDALADWWPIQYCYRCILAKQAPAQVHHLRWLTEQPIDIDALLGLPVHTFGYHYAAFIRQRGLSTEPQVTAFPPIAHTYAAHWLLHRFARVHDMHHVLVGFDVDVAGEMGLQAFNLRNFGEPYAILALASLPLTVVYYGAAQHTWGQIRKGWHLGGRAVNLLCAPLEDYFATDISAVRDQLGIVPG